MYLGLCPHTFSCILMTRKKRITTMCHSWMANPSLSLSQAATQVSCSILPRRRVLGCEQIAMRDFYTTPCGGSTLSTASPPAGSWGRRARTPPQARERTSLGRYVWLDPGPLTRMDAAHARNPQPHCVGHTARAGAGLSPRPAPLNSKYARYGTTCCRAHRAGGTAHAS